MNVGNRGGGNSRGQFVKHGPNTKWAQFKNMPPGMGKLPGGWVRVGSPAWKKIQAYNATPLAKSHGIAYHPAAIRTNGWNPASPQYKMEGRQGSIQKGVNANPPSAPKPGPGSTSTASGQKIRVPKTTKAGGAAGEFARFSKLVGNGGKVGSMMPRSMAKSLAGIQFDPAIHDMRVQVANQNAQGNQDLRDIQDWYNSAQGQFAQAGQQAGQLAQGVGQDATQQAAALSALGGGTANAGNGQILAAGANGANMANLMGQQDQAFANNMQGALGTEQAAASATQNALNSQAMQGYQSQLADLLGQRGQAQTQALQQIIQANNALAQQRQANRVSDLSAIVGSIAAMGNNALQNVQLQAAKQNLSAGSGGIGHQGWNYLTPAQKQQLIQASVEGPGGALRSSAGAVQYARSLGYTNPAVGQAINSFLGV